MKKLKIVCVFLLSSIALVAFAQAIKQDINSSVGNGAAMSYNLNVPNAINPAMDNIQKYEKEGKMTVKNEHPESDLSNKYNRNSIESIKK